MANPRDHAPSREATTNATSASNPPKKDDKDVNDVSSKPNAELLAGEKEPKRSILGRALDKWKDWRGSQIREVINGDRGYVAKAIESPIVKGSGDFTQKKPEDILDAGSLIMQGFHEGSKSLKLLKDGIKETPLGWSKDSKGNPHTVGNLTSEFAGRHKGKLAIGAGAVAMGAGVYDYLENGGPESLTGKGLGTAKEVAGAVGSRMKSAAVGTAEWAKNEILDSPTTEALKKTEGKEGKFGANGREIPSFMDPGATATAKVPGLNYQSVDGRAMGAKDVRTAMADIDNPKGFDKIFGPGAFADRETDRAANSRENQRLAGIRQTQNSPGIGE